MTTPLVEAGDWESFFGPQLLTQSGTVNTNEYLSTKQHVAVYFSASWYLFSSQIAFFFLY